MVATQPSPHHYFPLPQEFGDSTSGWRKQLNAWLFDHDASVGGSGSDFIVITDRFNHSLNATPNDVLIAEEDGSLRFATMAEEDGLRNALASGPEQYELVYIDLGSRDHRVYITADEVHSDGHYLMFMNDDRVVIALKHGSVIEFSQVKAHRENIMHSRDGELAAIESNGNNTFMQ